MKHIKQWSIFEGFNTDDYYQEIEYNEWFSQRLNRLYISDNLNNRIKNLFDSSFDYQKLDNQGSIIFVDKKEGREENRIVSIEVKIMINDDDWYYVDISNILDFNSSGYYKCDQFDGLKKLLKDKEVI
jgi:hypothetical protein